MEIMQILYIVWKTVSITVFSGDFSDITSEAPTCNQSVCCNTPEEVFTDPTKSSDPEIDFYPATEEDGDTETLWFFAFYALTVDNNKKNYHENNFWLLLCYFWSYLVIIFSSYHQLF